MSNSGFTKINNELLRFKAFYFFFLGAFGTLLPYLSVYFRQIGLSASHVGLLIGVRPIIQFASAPFWAIMADRYKKRKPILVMSIFAWLIMTLALAFVEPTTEICEMRFENNSKLEYVNYTKIRTGFFSRRSILLVAGDNKTKRTIAHPTVNKTKVNDDKSNIDVFKNRTILINLPRLNNNNSLPTNKSARYTRNKNNASTLKSRILSKYKSFKSTHRISQSTNPNTDAKSESSVSQENVTRLSALQVAHRLTRLPLLKRQMASKKENLLQKQNRNNIANNSGMKQKRLEKRPKTGQHAKTIVAERTLRNSEGHNSTVAFFKADTLSDNNNITIYTGQASGSGEFSSGEPDIKPESISIPKHVKEAAQKLQKQLTKSINLLNHIAKNSSEVLLHHAISMISTKGESKTKGPSSPPKTIPQLSKAINSLVKSNDNYSHLESSGSGIAGSSLLLSTDNDLTNLAMSHINPKDGLNAPDSLHQGDSQQSLSGVIHHNVLPHHILPFGNNDTDRLSLAQMLGDKSETSTSGSAEGSGETIIGMEPPSQIFSSLSQKDDNGKATKASYGEIQNSRKIEKSSATLKNLMKSNKHEMSRIFTVLLVLIVVGEFLEAPSATLADASLLEVLGENKQFYGKQRLFGSIGFGISSFVVGILLERSRHIICGDEYIDYMICFCAFGILMFATLLTTSSFEFHYSDTQSSSGSVFSSLCNVHYGSCLVAACVMGIDFSMSHNFLAWFLEDLGASKSILGLAVISRCFADTVTFYFAGSIIKLIGQVHVMIMVLISYTVIMLIFSMLHNPMWVIPVEILDGITYAMAWSSLTSYLAGAVPAESLTTLQGIVQGVYWGLGSGSGAITGGYLIHHIGVVKTFQFMALLSLIVCLLFSAVQWKWSSDSLPNDQPQTKYTYLPTLPSSKDTNELLGRYHIPRISHSIKGRLATN